jgi:hypothetical protein
MWNGPWAVWDSIDNGRLIKDMSNQDSSLSRPTKPIHSAEEGGRGFLARLAERILGFKG